MHSETALLATIAVGLALAFLFGFAAARLRLPPLVGYLIAGVAVGPFTPGFVADSGLAGQLAELGVILLMFGVGLHFSVRDLLAVRKIAVPGAVVQIIAATAMGAAVSQMWGWSFGAGLVFGLALSVASTVVLLRALEERNMLESVNGRIAIGWLIVEDLAMVVALVLLPALAGSLGGTAAAEGRGLLATLGITLGKVALFVALMLFVGARVVPWMLEQVARVGSRELFTLSVLALALGIAFGSAVLFGVSFALGAFFAGVVINGSDVSHAAASEALPLQDAFAVLFFVSVGMLFDPTVLLRAPLHVLATLAIVLIGKSVAACAIVLFFRYPIGTALTVSASLAQIGEFSFILAGLGVSLGLFPQEGQSLILAGAIFSITLNPLIFRGAATLEQWLQKRPKVVSALERPSPVAVSVGAPDGDSLHGHAIIVGFGRVGSTIGKALAQHSLPYIVIESDRELVEKVRARGVPAVYGDAARPGILEHAHAQSARVVIVTAPEPFHARQVVTRALRLNPEIDTVVRTHTSADQAYLERLGVGLAVMGERELALGMTRYALRGLGVPADQAEMSVQAMRLVPAAAHATPPRSEPVG